MHVGTCACGGVYVVGVNVCVCGVHDTSKYSVLFLLTKRFAYLFKNSSLILALQDFIHSALDGFGDLVNVLWLDGSLNRIGRGAWGRNMFAHMYICTHACACRVCMCGCVCVRVWIVQFTNTTCTLRLSSKILVK